MNDVNSTEIEKLFELVFADIGNRENIPADDWQGGWPSIVGGMNGIPTSRQFNTLQYITDIKLRFLYFYCLILREELDELREKVEEGSFAKDGGNIHVGGINTPTGNNDVLLIIPSRSDEEPPVTGGKIRVGNEADEAVEGEVMLVVSGGGIDAGGEEGGRVYVGGQYTGIRDGSVLWITEGHETPVFYRAAITNMEVCAEKPDTENWGRVTGALSVGASPKGDATFFAKAGGD